MMQSNELDSAKPMPETDEDEQFYRDTESVAHPRLK